MTPGGTIVHEIDLPTSLEDAFWTLLDRAREGTLDSSFDYWRPREWPPIEGTHVDYKAKVGGLSMRGISRFAEFNPPTRLVIESVRPPWPLHMTMSWDLRPSQDGTSYRYGMKVRAAPGFGWMARRVVRMYDAKLAVEIPRMARLF